MGIKGKFAIIIAGGLLLTASSYVVFNYRQQANSAQDQTINNNISETRGNIHAKVQDYPFKQAVKVADLVARVKITKLVEELPEPLDKSIFEAEITELYKGKATGNTIKIMQQGNSRFSFNDNELFKNGDDLILFMKKAVGEGYENTFWILGEETGTYKVEKDKTTKYLHDKDLDEITLETNKTKSREIQIIKTKEFIENIKKELKNVEGENK